MTTLRRILMATAQEQPVVTEPEPKKKHARRRFDEEKELHFEHSRNGYKRKRKDMSNGSGNDRNHREKDKSQPKRKLDRSPSEKEISEKPKPKLKKGTEKKKQSHGSHKASKGEAKSLPNGLDKKKKKKRPEPSDEVAPDPTPPKINKSESAKPKPKPSPPVKKEKVTSKKPAPAVKKTDVTVQKESASAVEPSEKKQAPKAIVVKPVVEEKAPPKQPKPPIPPAAAKKSKDAKQDKKVPSQAVVKEEKIKSTKTDLKQGPADASIPPPPPTEKQHLKDPVKPKPEKKSPALEKKSPAPEKKSPAPEKKSPAPEKKSPLKIEVPKPAPAKTANAADTPVKAIEAVAKVEIKSAEKKRKRDEGTTPKEKSPSASTPVAHRPPKRIASMKCPGTATVEGAGKDKPVVEKKEVATKENKDWVQCERCKEWVELPPSIDPSTLPDHWYCEMKTWGSKNTKCIAADKDSKKISKPVQAQPNGKKRNRAATLEKSSRASQHQRRARNQVQSSRPRINNILPSGAAGDASSKVNPRSSWKWVLCETCNQWRKVPPEVDLDKLPEKWYCSMNKWDPARASCSAPQEADEAQAQTIKTVSSKKFVTLPDGVNMYGGQIWPVQKKQSPMNYRELIVNHYRNFKQWELASSKVLNQRYNGTSLFVPRDVVRVKSSKNGNRKSLSANSKGDCISRSAAVPESLFCKMFPRAQDAVSIQAESETPPVGDEKLRLLLTSSEGGSGLLKLSKPWKRVKWDWTRADFSGLGKVPVEDST